MDLCQRPSNIGFHIPITNEDDLIVTNDYPGQGGLDLGIHPAYLDDAFHQWMQRLHDMEIA